MTTAPAFQCNDMPSAGEAQTLPAMTGADDAVSSLLRERQFTKALALAMQALAAGESAAGHARVAGIEALLGFLPRAERSWRRALQLEPSAAAYLGLGICLFQGGDLHQAIAQFRRGLAIDCDNLTLLVSAGIACLMAGEFTVAADYAERALHIAPDDPEAMLCAARARQMTGRVPASLDLVTALERQGYKPDEVTLLRAELLSATEDHAGALAETAELCERYPDSHAALAAFRRVFTAFRANATRYDYDELAQSLGQPPAPETLAHSDPRGFSGPVDVIMPVHNQPDLARRAIDAVFEHSGAALGRVIVIDDAGSPKTADMLSRLAASNPAVRLLRQAERTGFTRALQRGIACSQTAAFVALNSDTVVTAGWLEGLGRALRSGSDVAMAGPLSNNAAWQNYGPVFASGGEFASAPVPDATSRAAITAAIRSVGQSKLAETAMIHGFCAMVDRAIHDAAGGLDDTAFPEGYGEFQDLSYRLRAAGHRLVLALDTVVFHEKGASIAPAARAILSNAGRRALYARYSAFNYLFVEAACATHSEVSALRKGIQRKLARSGAVA